MAQLNIAIERDRKRAFKALCAKRGTSMARVINDYIAGQILVDMKQQYETAKESKNADQQ